MKNDNIDDFLKSLDDDDKKNEGFNRNYFGGKKEKNNLDDDFDKDDSFDDDIDKKNIISNKNTNYTIRKKSEEYYKNNVQPKVDVDDDDDDWNDDKDDFDDVGKFKNNDNIDYSAPVDIRKIGIKDNSKLKQCEIVYLGNGISNEHFLCNNLLCTKCDVKVSIFENKMWDSSVNYLFFRNNYARPEMLKKKLIDSYGTNCYSCQCTWNNISDDYVIASKVSNWICLGHH